jgi:hypothetical protein
MRVNGTGHPFVIIGWVQEISEEFQWSQNEKKGNLGENFPDPKRERIWYW